MRNITLLAWVVVLFLCFRPNAASAQDEAEYDRVVRAAVVEFDAGSWQEARALFRRAHDLNPSARTWRGLGLTSFELRRYVDAIAELEAALADPRKPLTQKQREEVSRLLSRARQYVSVYRVKVAPDGAEVLVDGAPAELAEGQLFLDPGQHTVVVRAPGYEEARKDLRVDAGAQDELTIELTVADQQEDAPALESAPVPAETPPAPPESPRARRRLWTWVLGGSALAATGVGVGLYVGAYQKSQDFQACDKDPDRTGCGAFKSKGKALFAGAIGTYVGAGLLLGGAVAAFFLEGRAAERPSHTSVLIGPTALGVSHSF
jgi:tetratricopeptide (TPR) repeat protein